MYPARRSRPQKGRSRSRSLGAHIVYGVATAISVLALLLIWRLLGRASFLLRFGAAFSVFAVLEGASYLIYSGRMRWQKVAKLAALGALAVTAIVTVAVTITFWTYARDPRLPSVAQLQSWRPKQVTRIVAPTPHGEQLLGEIYTERRTVAAYDDLPELLVDAFVVAEDAGFWDHGGIDYRGMVRAFFVNLVSGEAKQGASTITQQVVKNLLLSNEKTFRRKMQEIILARRVESTLSKEEILALYLNQIYFGQGRYGVVEAARYYFDKELDELDVGEIAYLAGLPQAPEVISEPREPAAARREYVLNQLVVHGKIDEATARTHVNAMIPELRGPRPSIAPEVVEMVRAELRAEHGDKGLDTLGARVRVTLRPDIQVAARTALQDELRKYDAKHKVGVPIRKVAADKVDAEIAKLARKLPKGGPEAGEPYPAVVIAVHDADHEIEVDLGGHVAAVALDGDDRDRLNPEVAIKGEPRPRRKRPSERFARGDVVEVVVPKQAPAKPPKHGGGNAARLPQGPEGAVVVIDVKTRKVLALVGGYHVKAAQFNRAVQARRQPGSTFKPFVYAAAMAEARYTAATVVNDAPDVYDLWKPKNYGTCCEGPVRLRHALAKSINTVAIRVAHEIGPARVAALANAMGIESDLPHHLSLSLGSGEVTPLELTNAFATFAAGGVHRPARIVDAIDGELRPDAAPTQALAPEIAYVVTDMMRSVLEPGGTGAGAAKRLKVPVAGKTGTSNDERDAWFVGVTPDYAIGVWIGRDDNKPLGPKQTGGAIALPVFVDVVGAIAPKAKKFERPPRIVEARIDKATGLLAADGAPAGSTMIEVFAHGTAPTEVAARPGEVDTTTFVVDEYGDPVPDAPDDEPETEP
jgi:penicillin-binding protein 1A